MVDPGHEQERKPYMSITRDEAHRACASEEFAVRLSRMGTFHSLDSLLAASRDIWFNQVRVGGILQVYMWPCLYAFDDSRAHEPDCSSASSTGLKRSVGTPPSARRARARTRRCPPVSSRLPRRAPVRRPLGVWPSGTPSTARASGTSFSSLPVGGPVTRFSASFGKGTVIHVCLLVMRLIPSQRGGVEKHPCCCCCCC
jgi:hypothetical protein